MTNDKLAALRHQHGLTQDDLAKAVGVSRQTIISIERGRYSPGLQLAFALADYFDVTVDSLFRPDR